MRVTFTVRSSDVAHHQFWLVPGQRVTIGRSRMADYAFPMDGHMSSLHLELRCDFSGCQLRDLESSNGTFVNRRRVREVRLEDRDLILAGHTEFHVEYLSAVTPAEVSSSRDVKGAVDPPSPVGLPSGTRDIGDSHLILPRVRRVLLEYDAGGGMRKAIRLRPGERLRVGRTQESDYVLPQDPLMSSRHFVLECDEYGCVVRDLDSRNGTFLDGRRIERAMVRTGEVLRAGKTDFTVRVLFSIEDESVDLLRLPTYTVHSLSSGIARFEFPVPADSLRRTLQLLGHFGELYLLVGPDWVAHFGQSESFESAFLYDWIPDSLVSRLSPQLLRPRDPKRSRPAILAGWGHDQLVCLFATRPFPEVLAHLRLAAQGKREPTGMPEPSWMFQDCRPSRLRPIMRECAPSFGDFLFSGVELLLMESEEASGWDLFASPHFATTLDARGFINAEKIPLV